MAFGSTIRSGSPDKPVSTPTPRRQATYRKSSSGEDALKRHDTSLTKAASDGAEFEVASPSAEVKLLIDHLSATKDEHIRELDITHEYYRRQIEKVKLQARHSSENQGGNRGGLEGSADQKTDEHMELSLEERLGDWYAALKENVNLNNTAPSRTVLHISPNSVAFNELDENEAALEVAVKSLRQNERPMPPRSSTLHADLVRQRCFAAATNSCGHDWAKMLLAAPAGEGCEEAESSGGDLGPADFIALFREVLKVEVSAVPDSDLNALFDALSSLEGESGSRDTTTNRVTIKTLVAFAKKDCDVWHGLAKREDRGLHRTKATARTGRIRGTPRRILPGEEDEDASLHQSGGQSEATPKVNDSLSINSPAKRSTGNAGISSPSTEQKRGISAASQAANVCDSPQVEWADQLANLEAACTDSPRRAWADQLSNLETALNRKHADEMKKIEESLMLSNAEMLDRRTEQYEKVVEDLKCQHKHHIEAMVKQMHSGEDRRTQSLKAKHHLDLKHLSAAHASDIRAREKIYTEQIRQLRSEARAQEKATLARSAALQKERHDATLDELRSQLAAATAQVETTNAVLGIQHDLRHRLSLALTEIEVLKEKRSNVAGYESAFAEIKAGRQSPTPARDFVRARRLHSPCRRPSAQSNSLIPPTSRAHSPSVALKTPTRSDVGNSMTTPFRGVRRLDLTMPIGSPTGNDADVTSFASALCDASPEEMAESSFVSAQSSQGIDDSRGDWITSCCIATFAVSILLAAAATQYDVGAGTEAESSANPTSTSLTLFRGSIRDIADDDGTRPDDASQSSIGSSGSSTMESPVRPGFRRREQAFKSPFTNTSRICFDSRSFENYLMTVPDRDFISPATDEPKVGCKSLAKSFSSPQTLIEFVPTGPEACAERISRAMRVAVQGVAGRGTDAVEGDKKEAINRGPRRVSRRSQPQPQPQRDTAARSWR